MEIPKEVYWNLMLKMELSELNNFRKVNKICRSINLDPSFWREKYKQDFFDVCESASADTILAPRVFETTLKKRNILTWKYLYIHSCRVDKNYPDIIDRYTFTGEECETFIDFISADCWGIAIQKSGGNDRLIPLTNEYHFSDSPAIRNRSSNTQIQYEYNLRLSIIENPELITDLLSVDDSLLIYMFAYPNNWVAIMTKKGENNYIWQYKN